MFEMLLPDGLTFRTYLQFFAKSKLNVVKQKEIYSDLDSSLYYGGHTEVKPEPIGFEEVLIDRCENVFEREGYYSKKSTFDPLQEPEVRVLRPVRFSV